MASALCWICKDEIFWKCPWVVQGTAPQGCKIVYNSKAPCIVHCPAFCAGTADFKEYSVPHRKPGRKKGYKVGKTIIAVSVATGEAFTFSSIKEACKTLHIENPHNIYRAIYRNGITGGYMWRRV